MMPLPYYFADVICLRLGEIYAAKKRFYWNAKNGIMCSVRIERKHTKMQAVTNKNNVKYVRAFVWGEKEMEVEKENTHRKMMTRILIKS